MQREGSIGRYLQATLGLGMLLLVCFVIGLGVQIGWTLLARAVAPVQSPQPVVLPSPLPTESIVLVPTGTAQPTPTATETPMPTRTPQPSPSPTETPSEEAESTIEYTIQAGDTLSSIASRFDLTVEAILAANEELDPELIAVGDVLVLPLEQEAPRGTAPATRSAQLGDIEYTVQEGDTLFGIAGAFDLSVEQLIEANPEIDPDSIGVGDVLVIPQP